MIFKPELAQKILSGEKTQTRRLVKDSEKCLDGITVSKTWVHKIIGAAPTDHRAWIPYHLKWQVGRDYAIQPGRGKKAIGRLRLLSIRREFLQDISEKDARAEGVGEWGCDTIEMFQNLWDSINKSGARWEDNPEVWVLEFEAA